MPVCVLCRVDKPDDEFGVQAVKHDGRPGRRPRHGVRNSRCKVCDSRSIRKGGDMASPQEIVERWDRRSIPKPANDDGRRPDGWILVDGAPMAVWLPNNVTPEDLGLHTWSATRRLTA